MKKENLFFKVNQYITLKLEDGITNIYVNEVIFKQCKYLLLNIEKNKIPKFDFIDSIDEAVDIHKNLYGIETRIGLDSKTEFIGHCSNLQVWVENDYDTRILHSNLSFPLLKELAKIGDKKAQKILKDEVAMRIDKGNSTSVLFLLKGLYLQSFTKEELEVVFENINYEGSEKTIFYLLYSFYNLGIDKALDKIYDLLKKGVLSCIDDFMLDKFTLEQLEILFNCVSEENQLLLVKINRLINEKWLLSKKKVIKRENTQILDFNYENY